MYDIISQLEREVQLNPDKSAREIIDRFMTARCINDIEIRDILVAYMLNRKNSKEEN